MATSVLSAFVLDGDAASGSFLRYDSVVYYFAVSLYPFRIELGAHAPLKGSLRGSSFS
jgi:hypothetical protein